MNQQHTAIKEQNNMTVSRCETIGKLYDRNGVNGEL